ncbi:hypothetical protein [Romboutsia sp.]|uniref:hypothetical protein n=1 Tax=Romboutsia sp. TaxID=1965302 RepID=UPI003F2F15FF
MKLFKLMAIISLLTLFTTGCSIDSESPDQLIKEKPIYDENKKDIYEGIDQLLSRYASLILPGNSKEVGIINEVDLNRDGEDELVAFEKKENVNENKTEVGFMVLTKNKDGRYSDKGNFLQEGNSIEYANFYDLNSDGHLEIVLLIKNKDKTDLYVYEFKEDKINLLTKLDPSWISDREDLVDTKIKIGYINDDNILDILLINYDSKVGKAYVSLVNLKKNFKLIDFIEFENVRNIKNLYITIGQVSKDRQGIILDIPIIKDNSYITQILYVENNKLNKVFSDYDKNIVKPYYIPVEDANKDKILDIPIANGSSNVYSLNSSSNVSWYKWNGKYNEDARLVFISQIYYNYKYNYKLWIPNELVGKFYIEQEYSGEHILFKFFYYDTESKPKNIFTISAVPKNIVEDNKNMNNQSGLMLGETYDYTFNLYKNNAKKLEELNITVEALKEYFSLIY